MNRQEYLGELRQRLQYRAAPRQRIEEIVAEVESHLVESGEDPLDSFGPPDRYAARLLRSRWHNGRFLLGIAAAVGAGMLVGGAASAYTAGAATVSVRVGGVLLAAAIFLAVTVAVLPVVHNRLPRPMTRLLLGVGMAVLATWVAAWLGPTTGLDERVLATLSPPGALAAALGLAAVAAAAMLGPYGWRWLRGRTVDRPPPGAASDGSAG